ncbi:MAPEG family protein [uncultured Sulfitobacter sp.]|jgi:uncharacterized membrane protein YecN with MAPEG domain|uniref:MAPEG family protein n=1 Tax=Sulfitobacter sp. SH22 TaxID=3421172 RepID=UPI0025DE248A|nr:MAPEG family protein [uncultured Sulfitobacter sp.]
MPLPITSLYAALTALVFLALSWRVIRYRRANVISLGDSGDKNLLKRMRAQANCAEYAPLALILMMLSELNGAPPVALHTMGAAFVAGRVLHAYGFASTPQKIILRQAGMALTLAMIAAAALGILAHALV